MSYSGVGEDDPGKEAEAGPVGIDAGRSSQTTPQPA